MMILERFYNKALAQASYLVGCGSTREAIVLDPTLKVDQYRGFAESRSLRIIAVAETHIHADFGLAQEPLALALEHENLWQIREPGRTTTNYG